MRTLLGLTLLGSFGFAPAQTQKPPISLTIAARETSAKSGQLRPLIVKEKNLTNQAWDLPESLDVSAGFRVEIVRNGNPVPKTKEMLAREAARKVPFGGGSMFSWSIRPDQEVETDFPIAEFYDMTAPGVYRITLTYDTNSYDLTKNIPIRSNTITVTVLPADGSPPL
jgi:hypothetical protein